MIEAFRIVREQVPDAQLVLAGSMATDDPEGFHFWERHRGGARRRPRHPPALEHPAGRRGADQRVPARRRRRRAEVAARGLRPHRERRAVEGPAGRRRPRRRHHAPDPRRATTATSSTRSRSARQRTIELLADPVRRRRDGRAGPASTCARTSCRRASSRTGCALFGAAAARDRRLAPGAVPVLGARPTGRFTRPGAAPVASSSALLPLVDCNGDRRAHDVGRGGDRRRRPRRGRAPGAAASPGFDLRLLDLDPRAAPHALRRRLERGAVVPAPRAVRPRPPAALRRPLPRGVGRRTSRSTRRSPTRSWTTAADRERRARARLPPRARPRDGARHAARPARRALHAHAVLRPELRPGAADRRGRGAVRARWRRRRPASTPLAGRAAYAASAREVLGTDAGRRPSRARSAPTPTRSPTLADVTRGRRSAADGSTSSSATAARAPRRPHRAVEEHRARLPRLRPAARPTVPSCASGSCSSRC